MTRRGRVRLLKTAVWLVSLTPLGWVSWRFFFDDGLGVDPVLEFEHWSGLTALTMLLGALAVTPLRRLTGFNDLQKVRRLVGLFAFFYVTVHFMAWLGLDQFFAWRWIGEDIAERPFITLGFAAFVLLIPLALTSTKGWIRRLGKNWVRLHRLVYVSAVLGVIHYLWATKADDRGPAIAATVVVVLLGLRGWWAWRKRRGGPRGPGTGRGGGDGGRREARADAGAVEERERVGSAVPTRPAGDGAGEPPRPVPASSRSRADTGSAAGRLLLLLLVLGAPSACATSPASSEGGASPHEGAPAPALPEALVEGEHFAVFRGDGSPSTLDAVLDATDGVDVVFLGEEHDDRLGHRVQLALLEGAYGAAATGGERPLVLSMEMFERDVQLVLDEYLEGLITEEHFLAGARPWESYAEAYRPLVEFAREHELPVVAANAPRRYVNRASRLGRESLRELPPEARATLAPLPYPEASAEYRGQWDSLMGDASGHMSGSPLDGQTLWDATMAHSIARALDAHPGALVLHVAGGFHVESGTGVPEVLDRYRPAARTLIVAVRAVEGLSVGFDPEEHAGLGDFVILTAGTRGGGGE